MHLTRFWHHDRSRRLQLEETRKRKLNVHPVETSAGTRDVHERQWRVRALKIQTIVQTGKGLLFKKKKKLPTANLLIITY